MKRCFFIVLLFLLYGIFVKAQDLNARVQVLSPQIENDNRRLLNVLEGSIRDFLNGKKWSADTFQPHERISCGFTLNIVDWDGSSNFKAEAQIQSSRPVYGTMYQSTTLNISDKNFHFTYSEGQPLDYSDQTFSSNLSSLLAYYSYIIIGLDYDSFSYLDGSEYYLKAQTVVNNAQNVSYPGWKAFEGLRNRYWLVENLTNKAYSPIREAVYKYHRKGLDVMSENPDQATRQVINTLALFREIDGKRQGSMLKEIFFTAKADELINIAGSLRGSERIKAYNILSEIDPSNLSKYEQLRKTK